MKILPEPIVFEWDKGNFDKNLKRHKVTFREAEEVFDNKPFLASEDIKHYCKVITILSKTIKIQKEIDNFYPEVEKNLINAAFSFSGQEKMV